MKRSVVLSVVVIGAVLAIAVVLRPGPRAAGPAAKVGQQAVAARPASQPTAATGAERDDARGDLVLEGQVLDGENNPVGGVVISLDAFPPRTTSTEADGAFSFSGLIERRYVVTASSAEGVAGPVVVPLKRKTDPVILHLVRPGSVTVSVVDAASRAPIAGATVEVRSPNLVTGTTGPDGTVALAPIVHGHWDVVGVAPDHARGHGAVVVSAQPAAITIALERGGSLRGRIVDDNGKPVAHARAWAVSSSDWTDGASPERDGAESDGDGKFELAALGQGTYRVHARARHFADTASRELGVSGAMTDVGDIVMNASATLKGRVVHRDGRPVPGAQVEAYIKTGIAPKTHAGSDGAFVMEDLPRTNVLVAATGDGASCWAKPVDLSAGTGEVTLTLELEGWIEGAVVDRSGAPVEGASVSIAIIKPGARLVRSDVTEGAGTFRFDGLPEGDYEVEATRPGVTTPERDPKVTAHTGTSVKLVLGTIGAIKGQVVFGDGSAPALATVRLDANGAPSSFSDGKFEISNVAPGSYRLRIEGPEIASTAPATAVVAEGKTTDLGAIRAERGRSIDGLVVDKDGHPVAGADVVAGNVIVGTGATVDSGSRAPTFQAELKQATTDADGKFTLRGLPASATSVVASHATAGRSTPVALSAETAGPLRLVLAPAASLSGTVSVDGHPTRAAVIAQPAASPLALAVVFADADGTFHYDRLSAGRYSVAGAMGDPLGGAPLSPVAVEVGAGREAHVDLSAFHGSRKLDVATKTGGIVFVTTETLQASTALDVMTQLGQQARGHWAMAQSNGTARFSLLAPVPYTACAAVFDASVTDVTTMLHTLTVQGSATPVTCLQVSATAASVSLP